MPSADRNRGSRRVIAVTAGVLAAVSMVGLLVTEADQQDDASSFVVLDPEPPPADVGVEAEPATSGTDPDDRDVPTSEPTGDAEQRGDCGAAPGADAAADRDAGAPTSAIVISEINYHPGEGDGREFVEIHNAGDVEVDLSGWALSGAGYCWPAGSTIPVGARWIVEGDDVRLDNGGDTLALVALDGSVVDELTYDDRGAWPAMADGHGDSLQRIDARSSAAHPGNWISAPPTPTGATPHRYGLLPVWSDVEHTVRPDADSPVVVTARLGGVEAARAELAYRVDFGAEVRLGVDLRPDGTITAIIPGQRAGSLVRYRLIAEAPDGATGTWPRQGDGATYVGTTVPSDVASTSDLLRIEWFMEDADYRRAFDDIAVGNDATYPAVVAVDGKVFDNARVRVKGRSSRGFPKPKWKVELPPGHRLQVDGLIDHPVDEFALHAAFNDKSAIREVLAHEAMIDAGLPVAEAFPVQVERNGEFYGLYTYIEQSDGRWRRRVGLDDAVVYEIGAETGAFLAPADAELSDAEFRLRYDRESGDSDDEFRSFLEALGDVTDGAVDDAEVRAFLLERVDVPSIVNSLAVSSIIQHRDYRAKNYRLALVDGRWGMIPYDLELTWGRRWAPGCESFCEDVAIDPPFMVANTALLAPFAADPVLASMVRARISTLREQLIEPSRMSARVDQLLTSIGDAAVRERETWGTYGSPQSVDSAAQELLDAFVVPQYERLSRPDAPFDLSALPEVPPLDDVLRVESEAADTTITNTADAPIDVSGLETGAGGRVSDGVVIPPGFGVTVRDGTVVAWHDGAGQD